MGTVLDHPMSSKEALETALLDWKVLQFPLGVGFPKVIHTPEGDVEGRDWRMQPDLANVREDSGMILGYVTPRYQLVQNVEAFQFLDELIEKHEMQYESAFSLRGGKQVVLLSRLPKEDEVVQDDVLLRYVLMSLTHDGTGAIRFGPTSVRVVCANTYGMAVGEGHTREMSISHKGNVQQKLQEARNILLVANKQFDQYANVARELAEKKLTGEQWERFLDLMCPKLPWDDPDWTERRQRATEKTRQDIRDRWQNPRQTLEGIDHSAWAAYNAVAEHIDHLPRRGADSQRKAEARFNVTLAGVGMTMKQRALAAACKMAKVELAV